MQKVTGNDIHAYLDIKSPDDSHGVYVGYQEIRGHCASTKIGRSKNAQAIQRGRAQGGANWWFHSYYLLPDVAATREVERAAHAQLKNHKIKGEQRQRELYNLSCWQASLQLKLIIKECGYDIRDVCLEI